MGAAYVYYSYEEWGRGYIGTRHRDPVGDDAYMGTYTDETYSPTHKIVLGVYETSQEALAAEVALHNFYEVDANPHFANKARQGSSKFYYDSTGREVTDTERAKNRAAWTPERREAMRQRAIKRNKSDKHRERMRKNNPMQSAEARRKISEGQRGSLNHNYGKPAHPNTAAGLRRGAMKPKSSETKAKMRSTATGRRAITNGERRTWLYPGEQLPKGWWFGIK